MESKEYDLFNCEETARLYAEHQPNLSQDVLDIVIEQTSCLDRSVLVDVGCGSGSSTRPFASHFGHVLGVDYSSAQIELAKELTKEENVRYYQGSVYEIPVEDNSVDCVFGQMIIQFLDIPKFYKEVLRVLKPDGALVLYAKGQWKIINDNDVQEWFQKLKTELYNGLWHDKTYFGACQYTNVPDLYPDDCAAVKSRIELVHNKSLSIEDVINFSLTWSAAGKYRKREDISIEELKVILRTRLGEVTKDKLYEINYPGWVMCYKKKR